MPSILNSSASFRHTTLLPPEATATDVFRFSRDCERLIQMDPDYLTHEKVPSSMEPTSKQYRLTDATPEGILKTFWGPSITVDLTISEHGDDFIEWTIRAPTNFTQVTRWSVAEENFGLALVEETFIEGNRMSLRVMKRHHARNWKKMHRRWEEQFEVFLEQERLWEEAKEKSREANTDLDHAS